jgi:hypothetical protein
MTNVLKAIMKFSYINTIIKIKSVHKIKIGK